jgi:hypothetical protein
MDMLRHYFISDNLDDLELFEEQLEASGITTPQIHVLSQNDEAVAKHKHLNTVQSFMKNDIIRSGERGALVGLVLSSLFLGISYLLGWTDTAAGWLPFLMLTVVIFGFCTWEGGLLGIHKPNYHFARFVDVLKNNKHIFFVDVDKHQEAILEEVYKKHPTVVSAGTGEATPSWLIKAQNKVPQFFRESFP